MKSEILRVTCTLEWCLSRTSRSRTSRDEFVELVNRQSDVTGIEITHIS